MTDLTPIPPDLPVPPVPPGWYADPDPARPSPGHQRYWDGSTWTGHTAPGAAAWPPPFPAPGAAAWPSPFPAPSGTSSRGRRPALLALLGVVVVVALVSGVIAALVVRGSSSKASTTLPGTVIVPPNTPTTPPTMPPPVSSDPAAGRLVSLGIRPADVGAADEFGALQNGTSVNGAATLDLCNGTYPSEADRTARYQVGVADQNGNLLLSTEAVLYQNASDTAQAFSELQSVVAHCPDAVVNSPVGEDPVKTTFTNPAPGASWPQVNGVTRLVFEPTATDTKLNSTTTSLAVYLRRGRVLLGIYFSSTTASVPPIGGRTTVPDIVTLLAQRLAALPSSVTK